MHPYSYCSKFPPLTLEGGKEFGAPLSENRGNCAGVGRKFQRVVPGIDYVYSHCEGSRQEPANDSRQFFFTAAPRLPCGEGGIGTEDVFEGSGGTCHDG